MIDQDALTKVTHDELIERGLTEEEYALLDQIWAEMDANPRPLGEVVNELREKGVSEFVILTVVINEREVALEDGTLVKRRVAIDMAYGPDGEEMDEGKGETSNEKIISLRSRLVDRKITDDLWTMIWKAEVEEEQLRPEELEANMRSGGFPERLIRRAILEFYPKSEYQDMERQSNQTARSPAPNDPQHKKSVATVVDFPRPRTLPPLDWEKLEMESRERYPKMPKTALKILKKIVQAQGVPSKDGGEPVLIFDIPDECYEYPPIPVCFTPRRSEILWVIDLLDRFGGEVAYGKLRCCIRRNKKRLPVFIVKEVSLGTAQALGAVYKHQYEHYFKSDQWMILGKEFPELDLMGLIIKKEEGMLRYIGFFDRGTAKIIYSRLGEGVPPEVVLLLE